MAATVITGMTSAQRTLARWIVACAAAAAIGASFGYVSIAPGLPRLLADALIIATLQWIAISPGARLISWIGVTIAALGLGLIAGIAVVLGTGLLFGALEHTNRDLYIAVVYGLGAAAGGLVAATVQAPVVGTWGPFRRATPWLVGSTIGAPFVLPALVISWFAPENLTVAVPLWLVGLAGGAMYGATSGVGLIRATSS